MPVVCMRRLREYEEWLLGYMLPIGETLNIESTYQQEKHLLAQISTMTRGAPASYCVIELQIY